VSCSGCGRMLRLTVATLNTSAQIKEKGWALMGWGKHACNECPQREESVTIR
jgi:hypothetical protein